MFVTRLNRRSFLRGAGQGLVLAGAPFGAAASALAAEDNPHFFLQVFVPGGWDVSYLFDARPLAMTSANLQQNYLNEDPTPWVGDNGGSCLATSLVTPLKTYQKDFSILNGVLMAAGFDGHDQNANFYFTGNPFGGEAFVPHFNGDGAMPLDFLLMGFLPAFNGTNLQAGVPLSSKSAQALVGKLRAQQGAGLPERVRQFARSRIAANASGSGKFSAGAKALLDGRDNSERVAAGLAGLELSTGDNEFTNNLQLMSEAFRHRVARSAIISIFPKNAIDAHAPTDAKKQPETYREVVGNLAEVFKHLKETSFDGRRSLFDVTTVVMGSEFSRTMRQGGLSIDATGTDHNPLNNSLIVAGKGIRGGCVVGASDRANPTEAVSEAHKTLDGSGVKIMGRPFDFKTQTVATGTPKEFHAGDYLSLPSLANSLYKVFGVPDSKAWLAERNGAMASIINAILA